MTKTTTAKVTAERNHVGTIALIVLASSPSSCWRRHPLRAGVVAIIVALASSPQMRWRLCRRCIGIIRLVALTSLLSLHWHCSPCRAGIVALVVLASLPILPLPTPTRGLSM